MITKNYKKSISIIVVSLNTKKEFLKTIRSIQKQDYKNYEIIIVDGKSSDGTIDEIKKLNKKKIKYIIERDNGIYDAMNKGSDLASGNWIIFLNSGDVFYNNCVLSNIFKKCLKKIDIIFGNTVVNNNGIRYLLKSRYFTNKTILMPFCHQSSIIKSSLIKKFKFSLKYYHSSDFDFFIKCFLKKKIFYYSRQTISTVVAQGLSDLNREKVFNENIQILKKYNYKFNFILNLKLQKNISLFKKYIKIFIPKNIKLLILKIKYRKILQ